MGRIALSTITSGTRQPCLHLWGLLMAGNSQILPRNSVAGPALGAVKATMCFLACLALGAVLTVNKAAHNWLTQATGVSLLVLDNVKPQMSKKVTFFLWTLTTVEKVVCVRACVRASKCVCVLR